MSDDTPTLTAELVVDSAAPLQPVMSPDGRWVAYIVAAIGSREKRRLSALWVAAADGSSPPRKLTAGTTMDSGPRWAQDSASLFLLSDRTGSVQLHRKRLGGGETEVLTGWHGKISDARPLADGGLVAVVATDEPTEDEKRRRAERADATVWGERVPRNRLLRLDLATGELSVVAGLGGRHVVELPQRPDGGPLAAISWVSPDIDPGVFTNELHLIDPRMGAVRDLGRLETEAHSLAWWYADGSWHLAYLAMPGPNGGRAVFDLTVPAAGAAGQHRNLTEGMAVCPTGMAQVTGGPPLALFADGLDTAIYRLDAGPHRFRRVSVIDGLVDSLTVSRSGEMVAARATTSYEPLDVHAGPVGGQLARISDTSPDLRRIAWGTQERLSYQASDGLDLDGLLILPAGQCRADGPFPLITLVHGGPYDQYADLCRARHKSAYAEHGIMPRWLVMVLVRAGGSVLESA